MTTAAVLRLSAYRNCSGVTGQCRWTASRCKTEAHVGDAVGLMPLSLVGRSGFCSWRRSSSGELASASRLAVTSCRRPLAEKRPKFLINKQRETPRHSSDSACDVVTVAVACAADDNASSSPSHHVCSNQ